MTVARVQTSPRELSAPAGASHTGHLHTATRSARSQGTQQFKGVRPIPSEKWVAEFKNPVSHSLVHLGTFGSAQEAARAYDAAALAILGPSAELNLPSRQSCPGTREHGIIPGGQRFASMNQWVSTGRKRTRSLEVTCGGPVNSSACSKRRQRSLLPTTTDSPVTQEVTKGDDGVSRMLGTVSLKDHASSQRGFDLGERATSAEASDQSTSSSEDGSSASHLGDAQREKPVGEQEGQEGGNGRSSNPFQDLAERLDALTERHMPRGRFPRCQSDPFPSVEGRHLGGGWDCTEEGFGDSEAVVLTSSSTWKDSINFELAQQ